MGFNSFPCNPYPISTEELNKGNNDALNTRVTTLEEDVSTLEGDVSNLNSNKASKSDIATEFSDLTNYFAGDLVYYDGALYEFQVDHTAGAWETSEVIQKDLSDIVTTLKSGLTSIIHSGNIPGGSSASVAGTDGGNVRMIVIKRASIGVAVVVLTEYWVDTGINVYGALPDSITVTKTALSNDIVITNNTLSAIAYLVIN